eukprot:1374829-Amorphochlora_amoeboformis.AAC.1
MSFGPKTADMTREICLISTLKSLDRIVHMTAWRSTIMAVNSNKTTRVANRRPRKPKTAGICGCVKV